MRLVLLCCKAGHFIEFQILKMKIPISKINQGFFVSAVRQGVPDKDFPWKHPVELYLLLSHVSDSFKQTLRKKNQKLHFGGKVEENYCKPSLPFEDETTI